MRNHPRTQWIKSTTYFSGVCRLTGLTWAVSPTWNTCGRSAAAETAAGLSCCTGSLCTTFSRDIHFSSPFFPFLARIFIIILFTLWDIYRQPPNFLNMRNCYWLEVKLEQGLQSELSSEKWPTATHTSNSHIHPGSTALAPRAKPHFLEGMISLRTSLPLVSYWPPTELISFH